MARLVFLDASPLWLACQKRSNPLAEGCRAWLRVLASGGAEVLIPEVADYEVRRELLRLGAQGRAALGRLEGLKATLVYVPITTPAMLHAAALWAHLRQRGRTTADNQALDADAVLAGQVLTATSPGDVASIAAVNLRHLNWFPGIDARLWSTIL
jgi:predicted nucleic acid-binding protein